MILPVESKEIARRLNQYLPQFARPLLDRLIERVQYETMHQIALQQEEYRRLFITQNVLGEAGEVMVTCGICGARLPAWIVPQHLADGGHRPTAGRTCTGELAPMRITQNVLGEAGEVMVTCGICGARLPAWIVPQHLADGGHRPTAGRTCTGELAPMRITQNVLGEDAGPAISAAGLEQLRRQFGPYFDRIADVDGWTAAVRRGDDPAPYMLPAADADEAQAARLELISSAEQTD